MGYRHGFAWNREQGEIYAWGFNMYNQLGTYQLKDLKKP
jgi:alpha-tubulin suppressor-like RCC1 family protein